MEVQVRLQDEDPGINAKLEIEGGAEREKFQICKYAVDLPTCIQ